MMPTTQGGSFHQRSLTAWYTDWPILAFMLDMLMPDLIVLTCSKTNALKHAAILR